MHTKTIFTIAAIWIASLLGACSAQPEPTSTLAPSPLPTETLTPEPSLTWTTEPTSTAEFTATPTPPRFSFGATPAGGQKGGISGVFVSRQDSDNCIPGYKFLRFYEDGLVLSVSVCSSYETLEQTWQAVQKWFHRDNPERLNSGGEYYTQGDMIWFRDSTTYDENFNQELPSLITVIVDYSGTYSEKQLVLDSYSHKTDFARDGAEYLRVETVD